MLERAALCSLTCQSQHHLSLPFSMEKPTPLINSSMLSEYAGQVVKVVGKMQRVRVEAGG